MDASKFREAFEELYRSRDFSDVTIWLCKPNGKIHEIFAHKIVLSARWRAFKDFFQSASMDVDVNDTNVDIDKVYEVAGSSKCQTPLLRYLYGLPLCEANEHLDAYTLGSLCEAAEGFGIDDLLEHALRKLEDLIVGLLDGIAVDGDSSSQTVDLDQRLEPFIKQLRNVLKLEGVDSDNEVPRITTKVCYTHFTILGRSRDFQKLCNQHPSLLWDMLHYSTSHGGDMLTAGSETEA